MTSDKDPSSVTNVLFIGGLPPNTADGDLMAVLGPYGALDCVTMRVPHGRSYAFALFRDGAAARAAFSSAQGAEILEASLRTEVARPAKAVRHLWVAGFGSSVSEEDLRKEFYKFGEIEDFSFFRNRNSAMIDFVSLEDAISAHKSMNGKFINGEQLCVDFQRSQPARREPLDTRLNGRGWAPEENFIDDHYRPKKITSRGGERGSKEGQPSSVLWVGYPPNSKIDEQKLHNAMIFFGEIERIKCFPSRKYAFVEFRSTDEARRAKEGLQGRLFNDSRIRILFSHSGTKSDPLRHEEWGPPGMGILPSPRVDFADFEDGYGRERKRSRRGEYHGGYEEREARFSPSFYRGYSPDDGSRWRGPLLKGGSFVCGARCVPIGRGVDLPLFPQAINCSARTDLETLARHYHDSEGFEAVFFLPDSEEDFASYTEFLQYLRLKNRAGVAKLADGFTTLFLVPPSDFLADVLNIKGPERLYGVVLRLPEPGPPEPVMPPRPASLDREGISLPPELISSLASIIPALGGVTSQGPVSTIGILPGGYGGPPASSSSSSSYMNQNRYQYELAGTSQSSSYNMNYMNSQTHEPVSYQNPYERVSNAYHPSLPAVGTGIGTADQQDMEKNQRYQSTLQFAANLLSQIQQKQQQQQQQNQRR